MVISTKIFSLISCVSLIVVAFIVAGVGEVEAEENEIEATIYILPKRLNMESMGNFLSAFIKLEDGYNVRDINVNTILIQTESNPNVIIIVGGGIPAIINNIFPLVLGWGNDESNYILLALFSRQGLIDYLKNLDVNHGDIVTLTIIGYLNDGTPFSGSDTIHIIWKHKDAGGGGKY